MVCELCGRELKELTRHHLIPKTRHANKKTQKMFTIEQLNKTISICAPCHKNIHANITEKDLERSFPTIESLKTHPEISKFISWIKKKPDGFSVPFKQSKDRR